MIILGVAFLSDASACVLKDGELLSAISEERINRVKLWNGVPHKAIQRALEIAGVTMDDVDLIATHGEAPTCPDPVPFSEKRASIEAANLPADVKRRQLDALDDRQQREKRVLGERTPAYLKEISEYGKPLFLAPHHTAHAACAYFGSAWEECYVLTADGWGEDASSTLWKGHGGKLEPIGRSHTFDSLGYFYGSVTKSLGFVPHRHEGKVLGLAAFHKGPNTIYPALRDMVAYDQEKRCFLGLMENGVYKPRYDNAELDACIRGHSREEVSAAVQRRLEEVVCEAVTALGGDNERVAVAGGVFANVKLNQRLRELSNIGEVYVFPNMGDGGLSVGAAWLAYHRKSGNRPDAFTTALLGNELGTEEVLAAIKASGMSYERPKDITGRAAELLAQGHVVVRVNGRMEFGPRALGSRSILYRCDEPDVNDWLNVRLARSEFMPFAPATLAERADEYYVGLDGGRHAAQFMTMTFDCSPRMLDEAPAAVHVDGTARPQLISEAMYPDFYRILSEYHRLTGKASLINTSFNMHEEPIVCTAEDAIRAFQASRLPWLALGDYLVKGTSDALN